MVPVSANVNASENNSSSLGLDNLLETLLETIDIP